MCDIYQFILDKIVHFRIWSKWNVYGLISLLAMHLQLGWIQNWIPIDLKIFSKTDKKFKFLHVKTGFIKIIFRSILSCRIPLLHVVYYYPMSCIDPYLVHIKLISTPSMDFLSHSDWLKSERDKIHCTLTSQDVLGPCPSYLSIWIAFPVQCFRTKEINIFDSYKGCMWLFEFCFFLMVQLCEII